MAKESRKFSFNNKLLPVLVILSIGLAFTVGMLWQKVKSLQSGNSGAPSAQPTQAPLKVNAVDVDTTGEPFIGQKDAPLIMAYWFDYQCPYCQAFEQDTLPTLIDKYVNTGKMKILFKDFQFLGEDSTTAGLAEHAVWETYPDKFLAWQEAMFKKQDAENSGWGKKADIVALVNSMGMDGNKISKLMDDKKDEYQKEMDADKAEAGNFGITGTPGFIVGTQAIYGAEPLNSFESQIDALLK